MRDFLRDLPEIARCLATFVVAGVVVYGAAYGFTYVLCVILANVDA